MAEDNTPERRPEADGQDEVLGKIDQLLNRHRPKAFAPDTIPVLSAGSVRPENPSDDGIPVLTDVVIGPASPASAPPASPRSRSLGSVLILRRLAIALDAEHIRLLAQIDRNDIEQARRLERLVGELKRALPGAVRAAFDQKMAAEPPPADDAPL